MADFREYSGCDFTAEFIAHYGVGHDKGGHSGRFPWGSGKNPKGKQSSTRSTNGKKRALSTKQKTAIKVGAAVVAGALVAYGGYKLYQHRDLISFGRSSINSDPFKDYKIVRKSDGSVIRDKELEDVEAKMYDKFKPDTFEPTRFKTGNDAKSIQKRIKDTKSLFLEELGVVQENNRSGSEFLAKVAAKLDALEGKGDISKSDVSDLILKTREYYTKLPKTEENEFLYKTVLYDIANLLHDS